MAPCICEICYLVLFYFQSRIGTKNLDVSIFPSRVILENSGNSDVQIFALTPIPPYWCTPRKFNLVFKIRELDELYSKKEIERFIEKAFSI